MGKTLRSYLIIEVAKSFIVGLGVFTFILVVQRMLEIIDLMLSRGVPATQVGKLFGLTLPGFLEITVPMAFLLSIVVAFGRMSNDGELLALRAAGISLYQMLAPVLLFGAFVAVSTLVLAAEVRPWAQRQAEQTFYEIAKGRATAALTPKVFNSDFGGIIIYVNRVDNDQGLLSGVMLADERDSYRRTTSFAETGRLVADEKNKSVYLLLVDGTSMTFHADQESYDTTSFHTLEVNLDLEQTLSSPHPLSAEPREMSMSDLLAARSALMAKGRPAIEERIELHGKFVLATAAFLMAIVGVPLGMQRSRAVHSYGFAVTLGVILVYYLMTSIAVTLARKGIGSAELDVWMPNIVLALGGLWMLSRTAQEKWLYPPMFNQGFRRIRQHKEN